MKIAIFGGAFDPVHTGHVDIINDLVKRFDKVFVVPSINSPWKNKLSDFEKRFELLKISLPENKKIVISDIEKTIEGKSYTYKVVEEFKKQYPNDELNIIIGFDNVKKIDEWQNIEKITSIANIISYYRDKKEEHSNVKKYNISLINLIPSPVSSTELRTGNGVGITNNKALEYMIENRMYFNSILELYISKDRIEHTFRVVDLSIILAKHYGYKDLISVFEAALFHDIAKELNEEDMFMIIDKELAKQEPKPVWHQFVGAVIAKDIFNIKNKDVLSAISKHTTGDIEMSNLDMIIHVADSIEPYKDCETIDNGDCYTKRLREGFKELTLEVLFIEVLRQNNKHLLKVGKSISDRSKKIFEEWTNK